VRRSLPHTADTFCRKPEYNWCRLTHSATCTYVTVEVRFHAFSTSTPDRSDWSALRCSRFVTATVTGDVKMRTASPRTTAAKCAHPHVKWDFLSVCIQKSVCWAPNALGRRWILGMSLLMDLNMFLMFVAYRSLTRNSLRPPDSFVNLKRASLLASSIEKWQNLIPEEDS
jgi:hypothetical protein